MGVQGRLIKFISVGFVGLQVRAFQVARKVANISMQHAGAAAHTREQELLITYMIISKYAT
jgi:hypothetical protein